MSTARRLSLFLSSSWHSRSLPSVRSVTLALIAIHASCLHFRVSPNADPICRRETAFIYSMK